MICKTCNTDNEPDSRFCRKCGHLLEDVQQRQLSSEEHIRIGELIYSAFKHKEAGDIEKAILACQGALALNDASPQAHVLLATLYQSKGDIAAAMYEYERALDLDPQSISAKLKLENLRDTPAIPTSAPDDTVTSKIVPYAPIMAFGAVFVLVLVALTMFFLGGSAEQLQTSVRQTTPQTTAPIQPYARNTYPQAQTQAQTPAPPTQAPVQQPTPAPRQNVAPAPRQGAPVVSSKPATSWGQQSAPRLQPLPQPILSPVIVSKPIQPVVSKPVSQPPPKYVEPEPAPSVDPEQKAAQLQRAGKYSDAISSYKEALNRTTDSGRIYQQIAICNQRLGNNAAAVNSYNQAIRSYRDQLAAGRDQAEVQRNIRACEAGIAVSKGH
ncbi:MAG TPA: tetratricopeptide repeat protein [Armatimonadota bacterium]|nr:tetratricopeptide repeat protein [Armatimonadota bacterium]